jgi:hypothetical protein
MAEPTPSADPWTISDEAWEESKRKAAQRLAGGPVDEVVEEEEVVEKEEEKPPVPEPIPLDVLEELAAGWGERLSGESLLTDADRARLEEAREQEKKKEETRTPVTSQVQGVDGEEEEEEDPPEEEPEEETEITRMGRRFPDFDAAKHNEFARAYNLERPGEITRAFSLSKQERGQMPDLLARAAGELAAPPKEDGSPSAWGLLYLPAKPSAPEGGGVLTPMKTGGTTYHPEYVDEQGNILPMPRARWGVRWGNNPATVRTIEIWAGQTLGKEYETFDQMKAEFPTDYQQFEKNKKERLDESHKVPGQIVSTRAGNDIIYINRPDDPDLRAELIKALADNPAAQHTLELDIDALMEEGTRALVTLKTLEEREYEFDFDDIAVRHLFAHAEAAYTATDGGRNSALYVPTVDAPDNPVDVGKYVLAIETLHRAIIESQHSFYEEKATKDWTDEERAIDDQNEKKLQRFVGAKVRQAHMANTPVYHSDPHGAFARYQRREGVPGFIAGATDAEKRARQELFEEFRADPGEALAKRIESDGHLGAYGAAFRAEMAPFDIFIDKIRGVAGQVVLPKVQTGLIFEGAGATITYPGDPKMYEAREGEFVTQLGFNPVTSTMDWLLAMDWIEGLANSWSLAVDETYEEQLEAAPTGPQQEKPPTLLGKFPEIAERSYERLGSDEAAYRGVARADSLATMAGTLGESVYFLGEPDSVPEHLALGATRYAGMGVTLLLSIITPDPLVIGAAGLASVPRMAGRAHEFTGGIAGQARRSSERIEIEFPPRRYIKDEDGRLVETDYQTWEKSDYTPAGLRASQVPQERYTVKGGEAAARELLRRMNIGNEKEINDLINKVASESDELMLSFYKKQLAEARAKEFVGNLTADELHDIFEQVGRQADTDLAGWTAAVDQLAHTAYLGEKSIRYDARDAAFRMKGDLKSEKYNAEKAAVARNKEFLNAAKKQARGDEAEKELNKWHRADETVREMDVHIKATEDQLDTLASRLEEIEANPKRSFPVREKTIKNLKGLIRRIQGDVKKGEPGLTAAAQRESRKKVKAAVLEVVPGWKKGAFLLPDERLAVGKILFGKGDIPPGTLEEWAVGLAAKAVPENLVTSAKELRKKLRHQMTKELLWLGGGREGLHYRLLNEAIEAADTPEKLRILNEVVSDLREVTLAQLFKNKNTRAANIRRSMKHAVDEELPQVLAQQLKRRNDALAEIDRHIEALENLFPAKAPPRVRLRSARVLNKQAAKVGLRARPGPRVLREKGDRRVFAEHIRANTDRIHMRALRARAEVMHDAFRASEGFIPGWKGRLAGAAKISDDLGPTQAVVPLRGREAERAGVAPGTLIPAYDPSPSLGAAGLGGGRGIEDFFGRLTAGSEAFRKRGWEDKGPSGRSFLDELRVRLPPVLARMDDETVLRLARTYAGARILFADPAGAAAFARKGAAEFNLGFWRAAEGMYWRTAFSLRKALPRLNPYASTISDAPVSEENKAIVMGVERLYLSTEQDYNIIIQGVAYASPTRAAARRAQYAADSPIRQFILGEPLTGDAFRVQDGITYVKSGAGAGKSEVALTTASLPVAKDALEFIFNAVHGYNRTRKLVADGVLEKAAVLPPEFESLVRSFMRGQFGDEYLVSGAVDGALTALRKPEYMGDPNFLRRSLPDQLKALEDGLTEGLTKFALTGESSKKARSRSLFYRNLIHAAMMNRLLKRLWNRNGPRLTTRMLRSMEHLYNHATLAEYEKLQLGRLEFEAGDYVVFLEDMQPFFDVYNTPKYGKTSKVTAEGYTLPPVEPPVTLATPDLPPGKHPTKGVRRPTAAAQHPIVERKEVPTGRMVAQGERAGQPETKIVEKPKWAERSAAVEALLTDDGLLKPAVRVRSIVPPAHPGNEPMAVLETFNAVGESVIRTVPVSRLTRRPEAMGILDGVDAMLHYGLQSLEGAGDTAKQAGKLRQESAHLLAYTMDPTGNSMVGIPVDLISRMNQRLSRIQKNMRDAIATTDNSASAWAFWTVNTLFGLWKRKLLYGFAVPRVGYIPRNMVQDELQTIPAAKSAFGRGGIFDPASRVGTMGYFKTYRTKVAKRTVSAEQAQRAQAATHTTSTGAPELPGFFDSIWNQQLETLLAADPRTLMRRGMKDQFGEDMTVGAFLSEAIEDGIMDSFFSADTARSFQTWARASYKNRLIDHRTTISLRNYFDLVPRVAAEGSKRQRMAPYFRMRMAGHSREEAKDFVLTNLYEWDSGVHDWEKAYLSNLVLFYSYKKNAMRQMHRNVFDGLDETFDMQNWLLGRYGVQRIEAMYRGGGQLFEPFLGWKPLYGERMEDEERERQVRIAAAEQNRREWHRTGVPFATYAFTDAQRKRSLLQGRTDVIGIQYSTLGSTHGEELPWILDMVNGAVAPVVSLLLKETSLNPDLRTDFTASGKFIAEELVDQAGPVGDFLIGPVLGKLDWIEEYPSSKWGKRIRPEEYQLMLAHGLEQYVHEKKDKEGRPTGEYYISYASGNIPMRVVNRAWAAGLLTEGLRVRVVMDMEKAVTGGAVSDKGGDLLGYLWGLDEEEIAVLKQPGFRKEITEEQYGAVAAFALGLGELSGLLRATYIYDTTQKYAAKDLKEEYGKLVHEATFKGVDKAARRTLLEEIVGEDALEALEAP